jgi:hypothetical protein
LNISSKAACQIIQSKTPPANTAAESPTCDARDHHR